MDGKITQVGKTVKVPAGAQVIKAEGLEVYPGMINAWGNIGLTEIGSVDVMNDSSGSGHISSRSCWLSAPFFLPASTFPVARVNGITTRHQRAFRRHHRRAGGAASSRRLDRR